jgi:hypothetical protein
MFKRSLAWQLCFANNYATFAPGVEAKWLIDSRILARNYIGSTQVLIDSLIGYSRAKLLDIKFACEHNGQLVGVYDNIDVIPDTINGVETDIMKIVVLFSVPNPNWLIRLWRYLFY